MKPLSMRRAARELGVALSALQAARESGRVTWPATSVDALRREWLANTKEEHGSTPLASRGAPEPNASVEGESRAEALRRKAIADANLKELSYRIEAGELVPAADVEREVTEAFTEVRTKLLALPAKFKQVAPHIAVNDVAKLDALIHEALERLAESANPGANL